MPMDETMIDAPAASHASNSATVTSYFPMK